ncbi:MAG: hypothetical protein IKV13_00785 [Akkermansia sp.]|nr:hypothetical protein [Akkermansia sp.]
MRKTFYIQSILAALATIGTGVALVSCSDDTPKHPAGEAASTQTENTYTLGNNLLSADFLWKNNGLEFGGLKGPDGTALLQSGGAVFTLNLANGKQMSSTDMKATQPKLEALTANPQALRVSEQLPGQAISATFTAPDGSFSIEWKAVLRENSHYIRQEFTLKATDKPVPFNSITALQVVPTYEGGIPAISGNTTHGTVAVTDKLFMGLETPMSVMTVGQHGAIQENTWSPESWSPGMFGSAFNIPESFHPVYGDKFDAKNGPVLRDLLVAEGPVNFLEPGELKVDFEYEKGNNRLNIVGVQLVTTAGQVINEDIHPGHTGHQSDASEYRMVVPVAGTYHLRYWVEKKTEPVTSSGRISLSLAMGNPEETSNPIPEDMVRGTWVRKTNLTKESPWKVSSVLGLFRPGQQRRSFLRYIEREKPVPYRTMVHYNDWYEVGIVLHDYEDPAKRTSEKISLDIINAWKKELFEKRKTSIDAFVIDDGWDDFNSLWDFHCGFPNGFAKVNEVATSMNCGLGTWLGPVGGYGASKRMRINSWNETHPNNRIANFELSNPEYFNAFVDRCKYMVKNYDMRYFKFDGISTKFHAKGPGALEDAEGILRVLSALREARPDIYINTTVGTWASPFWFMYADSIWRQENDFDQMGNAGDARDKWITYRDRLVHEVFVEGAPLFPINALMTHGTIITKNGPPRIMSKSPENCIKEIRTAFACGSGLQEIYADADLLAQEDGRLWDELAACIAWVRRNADVLEDTHWVGGNPWDKKKQDGDIYGWASWNPEKCTLALRNSSAQPKTLKATLRQILDVAPGFTGNVILKSSFADQRHLKGVMDRKLNVDTEITITLDPMEVIVMEGVVSQAAIAR